LPDKNQIAFFLAMLFKTSVIIFIFDLLYLSVKNLFLRGHMNWGFRELGEAKLELLIYAIAGFLNNFIMLTSSPFFGLYQLFLYKKAAKVIISCN